MGKRRLAVALALAVGFGVVLAVGGVLAGTGDADVDGDDVAAIAELSAGTDPLVGDTDGDGLDDGAERERGTDPTTADSDGDGLSDGREVRDLGTDPLTADTDGDDLADDVEVASEKLDPTVADTDEDGVDDGQEVATFGTDPSLSDADGDGLGDGDEVDEHGTDPTEADTDGDGLSDAREVRELATAATAVDTDGDGLADGREVDEFGTDPLVGDTDADGLGDGVEAARTGALAAADPLRRDVFVELDYMRGERPDAEAIALVTERFANAPIENPDGSTGIALHVVVDDEIAAEDETTLLDSVRLRATHFDNEGRGYHHALVVADARKDGESVSGFAATGHLVAETGSGDDSYSLRGQAHVLMHELGHSLGLSPALYAGIDSRAVAYDEYQSTMNYNAPWDAVRYSDGGQFDDWAYLDENLYAPPAFDWRLSDPAAANGTDEVDESTSATPVLVAVEGADSSPQQALGAAWTTTGAAVVGDSFSAGGPEAAARRGERPS